MNTRLKLGLAVGTGLGALAFLGLRGGDANAASPANAKRIDGDDLDTDTLTGIVSGGARFFNTVQAGLAAVLPQSNFTEEEAALFIGVTAAETNGYNAIVESWVKDGYDRPGQQYEGRSSLGNTQPGDGERFKGRGIIQITGRKNYTAFSQWVNRPDILADPDKVATEAALAVGAGVWYWTHYRSEDTERTCRDVARDSKLSYEDKIIGVNSIVYRGEEEPEYKLSKSSRRPLTQSITHLAVRQDYSRKAKQALEV